MAGYTYTGTYVGPTTSLTNPGTNNPVTVTGTFDTTNATAIYGGLDFPWTITNLGRIADTGSIGDGISLAAGGDVVNGASGSTAAYLLGGTSAGAAGLAIGPGTPATSATVSNYGTIRGFYGVDLAAGLTGATLTDAGTIIGTGGTAALFGGGNDLVVLHPGAVFQGIVQAGGSAAGDTLELAPGTAGAVGTLAGLGTGFTNFGTIVVEPGADWTLNGSNTAAAGTTLTNDGTLALDGTLAAYGALINNGGITIGGTAGRSIRAVGATANNYGSIVAAGTAGAIALYGGALTNAGTAKIEGAAYGILATSSNVTIDNAGTIGATGSSGIGITVLTSGTVTNSGTIIGSGGTALAFGQYAGRVVLDPGAVFGGIVKGGSSATGTLELAVGDGAVGTLNGLGTSFTNFASVDVDIAAQWLLQGSNTVGAGTTFDVNGTLAVAGTLTGTDISPAVTLADGGASLNNTGMIGGEVYGFSSAPRVFVSNAGTILAGTSFIAAVYLRDGGNVTNGGSGDAAALIDGPAGIELKGSHEIVANYGTILGVSGLFGVYLAAGGSLTNASTGTIEGPTGVQGGVYPDQSTITNAGLIAGTDTFDPGIALFAGGTVIDSGTIIGGGSTAVALNGTGSNRLVLDPGAVLGGIAAAGTSATNTLELAHGDGALGTIGGLGTSFTGFQSVIVDAGANWVLQGSNSQASGVSLLDSGTLTITGTLTGNPHAYLTLTSGASLTNQGTIGGEIATVGSSTNAVTNLGTIVGGGVFTPADLGGGILINGSTADPTALISGPEAVQFVSGPGTVTNYGTIVGTNATGINLEGFGGTVTDAGTISGGNGTAVLFGSTGSNRMVLDPGYSLGGIVQGSNSGSNTLELAAGNGSTGFVTLAGFTNFASIAVDPAATWEVAHPQSVGAGTLLGIGGTLVNGGILTNAGTVIDSGLLQNFGTFGGGVSMASGGTLVNEAAGRLGEAYSGYGGGPADVTNFGSILNTAGAFAVVLNSGGTVANLAATGLIEAGIAVMLGQNIGGTPGTVINDGTILGGLEAVDIGLGQSATNAATITGNRYGVVLNFNFGGGGFVTNGASGAVGAIIQGGSAGVFGTGTVVNGGTIQGFGTAGIGVDLFTQLGSNPLVEKIVNAGVIMGNGGTAVQFGGSFGNLLVDDPGAVFDGIVQGATSANNTLELAAGNGNLGTLSGLGSSFVGFGAITIDAGAQWSFAAGTTIGAGESLANDGTILVGNSATLEIDGTLGADPGQTGTVAIGGKLLVLRGAVAASETIAFTDNAGTLDLADPAGFAGTIAGFRPGDTLDLLGVAANQAVLNQGTLDISENGTLLAALAVSQNFGSGLFATTPSGPDTIITEAPCFCAGTRIRTTRGEVAVEDLAAGDVAITAAGAERPIVWIGQRRVDCDRHPRPALVRPVRVRAGAFAEGLPRRDLWLSPDHAVFTDGALVPIKHLRNGASIVEERVDEVVYFHVELATHDVLLAEALPAESYLDTGNRAQFANGGAHIALHPDFAARSWDDAFAPLCCSGPLVQAARRRLLARVADLADLRVRVGEREFRPARVRGGLHCFLLPAGTREACVATRAGLDPADGDSALERIGAVLVNGKPVPAERWRRTDGQARLELPPQSAPVLLELLLRDSMPGSAAPGLDRTVRQAQLR